MMFVISTCVIEQKYLKLSQPGIKPKSLDLQANTLPCGCKSGLLLEGSRSVLYTIAIKLSIFLYNHFRSNEK